MLIYFVEITHYFPKCPERENGHKNNNFFHTFNPYCNYFHTPHTLGHYYCVPFLARSPALVKTLATIFSYFAILLLFIMIIVIRHRIRYSCNIDNNYNNFLSAA